VAVVLRRSIGLVALALSVAAVAAPSVPPRNDLYLLAVGLDGRHGDPAGDVNAQDALHVRRAFAAADWFYESVHSRACLGAQATRDAVLRHVAWLAASVRAQDVAVVFLAVHGDVRGRDGYFLSLAENEGQATDDSALSSTELTAALRRIKGRLIVLVDSCRSGALAAESNPLPGASLLLSCSATSFSAGQADRPDRPSGFFVIALCEALSGLADTNDDRIVTLQEVEDYLPDRAQAFFRGQRAVVVRQSAAEAIPLARVNPAFPPQTIWTPQRARNPFGAPDVADADGVDVQQFAATVKLSGRADDPNATRWSEHPVGATGPTIEGEWSARWNNEKSPRRWANGKAEIRIVRDRVYILFEGENGAVQLIDALRRSDDTLVGRYVDLLRRRDSTPFVGRIIDRERIDGQWGSGRWDFRRTLAK
jgi:hypothetical protein